MRFARARRIQVITNCEHGIDNAEFHCSLDLLRHGLIIGIHVRWKPQGCSEQITIMKCATTLKRFSAQDFDKMWKVIEIVVGIGVAVSHEGISTKR
jgi:hypothetical protein